MFLKAHEREGTAIRGDGRRLASADSRFNRWLTVPHKREDCHHQQDKGTTHILIALLDDQDSALVFPQLNRVSLHHGIPILRLRLNTVAVHENEMRIR